MPQQADPLLAAFALALRDPTRPPPPAVRRTAFTTPNRRFDVYRNNVAVGLIEVLESAFPTIRKLVGDDFFRAAARAYVNHHPPTSPVLLLYGDSFGDFLDGFPPARPMPYVGDVARLEHAWLRAFHAGDAAPAAIGILAHVPADRLAHTRLLLHPSVAVLRSRWPVASIWSAAQGKLASDDIDMKQGEDMVVVRPRLDVEVRVLPAGGHAFIARLAEGALLQDAAEAAAQAAPETDLATHLGGLFHIGAVIGVEHAQP